MTLDVRIDLHRGDFHLDVSFVAPGRGVTAVFGPSGCGKTSLLRALAGLEPMADGRVVINGEVWDDDGVHRTTAERGVGYVFQEPSLFMHLSVEQNLLYGYRRLKPGDRRISRADVIELLGIEALLPRPVAGLSGGEAQRVAIGRALLASPRLLLLDEPLAALDRARKAEILPFLERLHENLSIPMILVSHALDEVVKLADTLLLMDGGQLTARGPLATVLSSQAGLSAMAEEPFSVVTGEVTHACNAYRLSEVQVAGHRFLLPKAAVHSGQRIRLRLLARDISLSLVKSEQSSILNCLPVQLLDIGPVSDDGQRLVRLQLGRQTLLARVSALSSEKLGLEPGMELIAQIKAASVIQ